MRKLLRTPTGSFGVSIIFAVLAVGLLAPLIAPYDPLVQHAAAALRAPGHGFFLGTDEFGRDILSRIIYGSRSVILVGVLAVSIGGAIGVAAGLVAGYFRGAIGAVVVRISDTLLAFPTVLVGVAITAVLGPGDVNIAWAVAIVNIPIFARLTRASVLEENNKEYVQAGHAIGLAHSRILWRHILPNCLSPLLIQASVAMGQAVLLDAGLSFLGLGTQPPFPSWGSMLFDARRYMGQAPWYALFPGLAITVFLLGLNLTADILRDIADPKTRRGR